MTKFISTPVEMEGSGDVHATFPMSAYYIANLLSALHCAPRTGDWWWEVQYRMREAHQAMGCPSLVDNDRREWEWSDDDLFYVVRRWDGMKWINE